MPEHRAWRHWPIWLAVGTLLLALVITLVRWWQPIYRLATDQARVAAWVASVGPWGPLAIILLQVGQVLLAPIPGQAIQMASGYLYGPWLGTLYSLLGLGLGSLIAFLLARRVGRPLAIRFIGRQSVAHLDELARKGGTLFFFLVWLLPFAPDDLACLAAGLTPLPLHQFLMLMLLGRLPGVLVSVWLGAHAAQVSPFWWGVLLAGFALAALALWRWGNQIQGFILRLVERLSKRLTGS